MGLLCSSLAAGAGAWDTIPWSWGRGGLAAFAAGAGRSPGWEDTTRHRLSLSWASARCEGMCRSRTCSGLILSPCSGTLLQLTCLHIPTYSVVDSCRLGECREECLELRGSSARLLQRRYFLVEKAKDASVVGIVVGTLGVAGYRDAIMRVRHLARDPTSSVWTLVLAVQSQVACYRRSASSTGMRGTVKHYWRRLKMLERQATHFLLGSPTQQS